MIYFLTHHCFRIVVELFPIKDLAADYPLLQHLGL
nr:MAG TPA: hypothetical protein [Bacteriophage sp.]